MVKFFTMNDVVADLSKTRWLERLRGISLSDVPPVLLKRGSRSRFEHSLNVYRLSKVVIENNNLPHEVAMAGLLHDVGHAPFGHVSDFFLRIDEFGKDHVSCGADLIRGEAGGISAILDRYALDKDLVAEIMEGEDRRYSLFIDDSLDLDGLDNAQSFYTAAGLNEFYELELYEPLVIANSYTSYRGQVCLDSASVEQVKRYNELRRAVARWVWERDECLKPWSMLGKALDLAYDHGEMGEDFFQMTNEEALSYLSKMKSARQIMKRVMAGKFYHRVYRAVLPEYHIQQFISRRERLAIEREVSKEDDVIVVVGKMGLQKRVGIPFLDLSTGTLLEPDSFFKNEGITATYLAVFCENKRDATKYRERVKDVF